MNEGGRDSEGRGRRCREPLPLPPPQANFNEAPPELGREKGFRVFYSLLAPLGQENGRNGEIKRKGAGGEVIPGPSTIHFPLKPQIISLTHYWSFILCFSYLSVEWQCVSYQF